MISQEVVIQVRNPQFKKIDAAFGLACGLLYTLSMLRNIENTKTAWAYNHSQPERTTAMTLLNRFWNDDAGFIISAELVLVSTIAVLAMVVGLSEIAININHELEDVGCAFGSINQSFQYLGVQGHNGYNTVGSSYLDQADFCDCANITTASIMAESGRVD